MNKISEVSSILRSCVDSELIPGYCAIIGQGGETILREAYGFAQITPTKEKMTLETRFDIASLTKLTAVWPGIIRLLAAGGLTLSTTFGSVMGGGFGETDEVCVFELLTHTAGLIEFMDTIGETREERLLSLYRAPLKYERGKQVVYSDLSYIFLGEMLAKKMNMPLERAVELVFRPLGMSDTGYNPPAGAYCAATEIRPGEILPVRGSVHDERAEQLSGVAGHAGIFSTADDLARFSAAILTGNRVLPKYWVEQSFINQTRALGGDRSLGWIIYHERENQKNIVGHTGFTGTSIWLDAQDGTYAVILANRVHPTRLNGHMADIRKAAFEALFGVPYC